MRIWLIAGAFSGIGKTTLAGNLRTLLPESTTLKIGHGQRKTEGGNNYFTTVDDAIEFISKQSCNHRHCIVESARLIGSISADIMIFLDNLDGDRRRDASVLRKSADIVLGHRGNPAEWKNRIAGLGVDTSTRNRVLYALREQHDYLRGNRLALRTKIWFASGGKVVFGEGLARLLYGIDAQGSLSAASRSEEISYRHAWGDIKRAEERLGFTLIERQVGGRKGGGARLTDKAHRLLQGYEKLRRKSVRESDKWFRKLLEEIDV
jgi:molybdate transport system regulatory protein